jgi:hypothetical protein
MEHAGTFITGLSAKLQSVMTSPILPQRAAKSTVSRVPCPEYSVHYFPSAKDSGNAIKSQILRLSYDD